MADSSIGIQDASSTTQQVDTRTRTNGDHVQTVALTDPASDNDVLVTNGQPAGTAYAGVTRNIPRRGSKSAPTAVTVGTSAASIIGANSSRISAIIMNNSASTIYLGKDGTLTVANGIPLASGAYYIDNDSSDAWFAIAAFASLDVRVLEIS